MRQGFCFNTLQANATALIISILFAYITNKIFVFGSKTDSVKEIFREFFSFLACRLGTGALDMAFMYVFVDILGFYDILMKILSNVIVIILNYIFSKLIIFAKNRCPWDFFFLQIGVSYSKIKCNGISQIKIAGKADKLGLGWAV